MTYTFLPQSPRPFSPGLVYEIPTAGFSAVWLQSFLTSTVTTGGCESHTQ